MVFFLLKNGMSQTHAWKRIYRNVVKIRSYVPKIRPVINGSPPSKRTNSLTKGKKVKGRLFVSHVRRLADPVITFRISLVKFNHTLFRVQTLKIYPRCFEDYD